MSERRYDPHIPKNGGGGMYNDDAGATSGGNANINKIQSDIDDTRRIMRENIEAVRERGEGLTSLEGKTDMLSQQAQGFKRGANNVRKVSSIYYEWKDMKMRIIIGVGLIIIILLIVIPIIVKNK
ncbi:synaptobrevin [Schizopora paradoxa]|uniref:Synaptobrevin n=1 Tax=Schizopora paradoxa TaxID=27342 RepID=A0A0H2S241_9AGAM|nr:synaptobrevin [Schizopora paradoxa]